MKSRYKFPRAIPRGYNKLKKTEVFRIITHLTSLTSAEELIKNFSVILSEVINLPEINIFELIKRRIFSKSRKYQTLAVNTIDYIEEPFIVEKSTKMRQCMEAKKPIIDNIEGTDLFHFFYPVIEAHKTTHIIKFESSELRPELLSDIDQLITIFNNQLSILHEKDLDYLTGLFDRQYYNKIISTLCYPKNKDHFLSGKNSAYTHLAILDIDNFKMVNDTYGHLIGDEVLIQFASILKDTFRREDYIFRYGGEEFCIVFKQVKEEEAYELLERFRKRVEEHKFPKITKLTVSIGYVKFGAVENPFSVCDKADRALYYVKKHGRNQIKSYYKLLAEKLIHLDNDEKSEIDIWRKK